MYLYITYIYTHMFLRVQELLRQKLFHRSLFMVRGSSNVYRKIYYTARVIILLRYVDRFEHCFDLSAL